MPKTKKTPLRMCIACREAKEKNSMLRIVRNKEGAVSLDFSGKASGRGSYICSNEECIKKLKKQRLLNKVFSCEIELSVYDRIEEEFSAGK